jgi:hypothetical protein
VETALQIVIPPASYWYSIIRLSFNIAMYLTQAFVCFVGIVGMRKYKQLGTASRVLELYILLSVGIDIVKDVMMVYNVHTLWVSQCFSVVELLLFAAVLHYWRTSKLFDTCLFGAVAIYLIVWVVGKFTFEPFTLSDVYSGSVSQIIQIGFGGWLLLEVLRDNSIVWKDDVRFWVVSGIVFYAAAAFFLFGMFNVMLTLPRQTMLLVWIANLVFLNFQYSFFLRAFFCKPASVSQVIVQGETGGKTD